MKKTRAQRRIFSPTVLPMAITTLLFVFLPLCYIIYMSFMERGEIWGITDTVTLQNYIKMLEPVYGDIFLQSFLTALITTALTLLIGYPFSYCVARLSPKYRQFIIFLLMAPFWLNSLLRLNGWVILMRADGPINAALQAMGIIDGPAKLLYTTGAMLLGMVYALIPQMILATYNSIEKMDWSLVEAARDLGSSPAKAFLTMTLPQTLPGIIAGCVLVFVPSVGLFFISDLLGGGKTMLLGNLIKNQLLTARNWPFGAALSVIMLALTTIFIAVYKKATGKGLGDLK